MDQRKIGEFLKNLRKEKGLTQEQLADKFNVTGRTVSRWETGNNMPDIATLIDLAEYYEVSIPELIDGERKGTTMTEEIKEVAQKVSGYTIMENKRFTRRMAVLEVLGLIGLIVFLIIELNGLDIPGSKLELLGSYGLGMAIGMSLINILLMTGLMDKIKTKAA